MRSLSAIGILLASVVSAGAQVADAPPEGPDPFELTLASAKFVAGLDAFSFHWFLTYDEVEGGREKLTYAQSGTNTMVRGVGFAARTERDNTYRDYFFDGKTFTIASPNEKFYASTPFDGDFNALVEAVRDRTDSVLPMWSMMSTDLPQRFTEGAEGAAYLGTTLLAGTLTHHVGFAGDEGEDWQVWISADPEQPVPLMIVITDTATQGWPQSRILLTDWKLSVATDPAQFTFAPGPDDLPLAVPALTVAAAPTAPAGEQGAKQ